MTSDEMNRVRVYRRRVGEELAVILCLWTGTEHVEIVLSAAAAVQIGMFLVQCAEEVRHGE